MAASADLQALQLQIRNLEQKIDFQHREIKKRDMHIRDLRDAGLVADLERLERSLCRLSLQMEHMQLVIKNPARSFHTFALPEKTASSAHTIFVRPPSGNRLEVTIPPGKLPGDIFTVQTRNGVAVAQAARVPAHFAYPDADVRLGDAAYSIVVQIEDGVAERSSAVIADSEPLALPVVFVPEDQKEGVAGEHQTRRLLQPAGNHSWL